MDISESAPQTKILSASSKVSRFISTSSTKPLPKTPIAPELNAMPSFIRAGDILVVHSMDRLARNLFDLRQLVTTLMSKEIRIEFVKEGLTFSGE